MAGQRIIQADGAFEFALGLVLLAGVAANWIDAGDFPAPVGTPVIVLVGCALLIVGVVLWRLARDRIVGRLLRTLATANLASAAAALAWWIVAAAFSTAGSALMLTIAVALVVLAAAQLHSSADRPTSRRG